MGVPALVLIALLVGRAHAARPPRDYRAQLFRAEAAELDALNRDGRFDEAIAQGRAFIRQVEASARVAYEVGLAFNRKGQPDQALDWYSRAIHLDPNLAEARYDRGEILLGRGRNEAALVDFLAAARVRPDHWAVHFRLAQIAGRRADAKTFEAQLLAALRDGFDFHTITDDPEWRRWMRDPTLGRVLKRLIVVYSDDSVLQALQGDSPAP